MCTWNALTLEVMEKMYDIKNGKKKTKKLRDLCNVVVVRIVDTDLRNRSTWTTIYR